MLTIPERWGARCIDAPRVPFLSLPGASLQLGDPVAVAQQLAMLLPVLSCDTVDRPTAADPFHCHLGGLRLGRLSIVALWGTGLRGEVEGTAEASFILPYRGSGRFRLDGRSLVNLAGHTILWLPPGPWRTSNDAMGGVTVRLDPELLRQVGRCMAGPQVAMDQWTSLGCTPLLLRSDRSPLAALFGQIYGLMAFIDQLLLRHGQVPDALRLDDLLLRQMVALLAPALLAEQPLPDPEPSIQAIDELVDWMHAHCHEPLSLSDLEQRAHYSRRSLQYAFRNRFGCGPMQYLRRLRLWRARQRLEAEADTVSVAAVAHACGYLSASSFSRDFRQCFGIAPSRLLGRRGGSV